MKPGDMIEWVYKYSGQPVHKGEQLLSSIENCRVPCGGGMVHLLVSIDEKTYSWLNENGLFHARVDDTSTVPGSTEMRAVVPRTRAK